MFLRITFFLMLIMQQGLHAQENLLAASIPAELKENANAVIRSEQIDITISSRKSMNIARTRTVTVFNEGGLRFIDASEYFDGSSKIKSISAVIYNAFGKEIKKVKEKDFSQRSVSEGSIITDNKIIYLDYTPVQYPFTVVFTSEKQTSTTAFIPLWSPVEGNYASTEYSGITINYEPELGFKYKPYNFTGTVLGKEESAGRLSLHCEKVLAIKEEDYSPSFQKTVPHVLFGLEKFNLEGVEGEASTWNDFSIWMYNNLLTGTDELPDETVAKIKSLTGNETDALKKAKIVYEYVQSKTRYISIQLGIGGWKPMKAKDVDRLGYGDCKALTNYTRALLNAVGVEAYYTVVYGDRSKRDIREDFVSMQGNHVILAIPHKDNFVWLECTSQSLPFNFQGDFTDDRMVLVVKPDGGQVVRTHIYDVKANSQVSTGAYSITPDGGITGSISIVSKGIQYDNKYILESKSATDLNKFYKSGFSNINNLVIKKTGLFNNKDGQEFKEEISIEAESYCTKNGNRFMVPINAFNQSSHIPQRYRDRKNPFEITRGFYDTDEITIQLPEGFTIEAKPETVTITDKFGEYKAEYVMVDDTTMLYKRTLLINNGQYESADYEKYRQFREKIARNDNAKMVLIKN